VTRMRRCDTGGNSRKAGLDPPYNSLIEHQAAGAAGSGATGLVAR